MALPRVLEPEVMDTAEEAAAYDGMDHRQVNVAFVDDLLQAVPLDSAIWASGTLDVGTGTALIPIELCCRSPQIRVHAIDLAGHMLTLARTNVAAAKLSDAIHLEQVDAKSLQGGGTYGVVMSNSIIHHVPDPRSVFRGMWGVLKAGGVLFVRDLVRPETLDKLTLLVEQYAGREAAVSREMFRASLHAALALDEVGAVCRQFGIVPEFLGLTSDRHWTLVARRPAG